MSSASTGSKAPKPSIEQDDDKKEGSARRSGERDGRARDSDRDDRDEKSEKSDTSGRKTDGTDGASKERTERGGGSSAKKSRRDENGADERGSKRASGSSDGDRRRRSKDDDETAGRDTARGAQDEAIGFFRGFGSSLWGYVSGHPHTVLYAFLGLALAVLILWLGLWYTIVIALFVLVGAAIGQIFDGETGIISFFARILGDKS